MLQSLHGAAQKWIGVLLFGMLTLSFVIWGIADVFRGRTPAEKLITVGKLPITAQQMQNEVQSEIAYLQQMTGRRLTIKQAVDYGIVERTENSLITRALMEQEAQRLGLRISDQIILKAIQNVPDFKNPDGSFNAQAFKSALARIGMNEQTFIADQRISLAREQLLQSISAGATVPPLLSKALAAAKAETRTFETYQVKFADMPVPAAPDDATLTKFMTEHPAPFTRPEYRKLSFVRLSAGDMGKDIGVSEEELKQAYSANSDAYNTPEHRTFKQVVLTDKAKAQALSTAAQGKDLTSVAKAQGANATTLADMGKTDLPDELQEAAFKLNKNEVSAPVQSALGWHVLQVTSISPAQTQSFEQARGKLENEVRLQKAGDLLVKQSQKLDDLLASGAGLAELSDALGVPVQTVAAIDAQGHDDHNQLMGPVFAQPEMLQAAFRLIDGAQSDLVTTPAGDYYIVKVDSITPSALRPLAEVKPQVLAAWNKDQQQKAATAKAQEIAKALGAGQSMNGAATQFKVETSLERDLSRTQPLPKYLPADATATLFGMKQGEVKEKPAENAIVVIRMTAINHPVTVEAAKPDPALASQLQERMGAEVFAAYADALKERYKVKIDQPKIDALFANAVDKTATDEEAPE